MRRNPNLAEPIGVADQLVDIAPEKKKDIAPEAPPIKAGRPVSRTAVRLGSCIAALTIALPILSVPQGRGGS